MDWPLKRGGSVHLQQVTSKGEMRDCSLPAGERRSVHLQQVFPEEINKRVSAYDRCPLKGEMREFSLTAGDP